MEFYHQALARARGVLIFSRLLRFFGILCDRINSAQKSRIAQSIISKLLVSSMPIIADAPKLAGVHSHKHNHRPSYVSTSDSDSTSK